MASFKQLKLFVDKELDSCLQNVLRPFTEHVYFPETQADPLKIEGTYSTTLYGPDVYFPGSLEHHHDVQVQNLSISGTLACATCQTQFHDRSEQVCSTADSSSSIAVNAALRLDTSFQI